MVEAVRTGFLISRSQKAANAWAARQSATRPGGGGLEGADLDKVVTVIGLRNPGRVREERMN